MKVFDDIGFPLKMKKVKKAEIKTAVEDVAGKLELSDLFVHRPQLSGKAVQYSKPRRGSTSLFCSSA